MFKVGIIKFKDFSVNTSLGIPQGSTLSTLLLNIYLSALDNYIKELKVKYNREGTSVVNLEFRKHISLNLKKFKVLGFRERIKRVKLERDKVIAAGINPTITTNQRIKIHYVRYLDDMLFGFYMDKPLTKIIINDIRLFIQSNLHLDCSLSSVKSKLVHGISESTVFLGFKIGLYPTKINRKSEHLTRFYKLNANIKRKKVMESEKYFKMQELILSKMHREVTNLSAISCQTLVKKSHMKAVYDHRVKISVIRALKNSLASIEAEILATPLVSHISKKDKQKPNSPFNLAEQKRLNLLKFITQKWVERAQAIAAKEDFEELLIVVGKYLSPEFIEAREIYLKKLEVISSKDFSENVINYVFKRPENSQTKSLVLSKVDFNYRNIRILFPKEEFKKKLRALGIVHKVITKPKGVGFLTSLSDYDIINWFELKANGIWNYYSCVDNIWDLKNILNWLLRYSLLGTLAMKHKSTIKQIIRKYSLAPCIYYFYEFKSKTEKAILVKYPSKEYYNNKKKEFNSSSIDPIELEKILRTRINILNSMNTIYTKCAVLNCENNAQEIHYIQKLGHCLRDGVIKGSGFSIIQSWKGIISALSRKQVLLCSSCYSKIYFGKIFLDDLDFKFIFNIENGV